MPIQRKRLYGPVFPILLLCQVSNKMYLKTDSDLKVFHDYYRILQVTKNGDSNTETH